MNEKGRGFLKKENFVPKIPSRSVRTNMELS